LASDVYVSLSPDGQAASVETTWHGVFVPAPGAPPLLVYGTYDDVFVRSADGWLIAERVDHPTIQLPVAVPGPSA
jgi:hypothetical protein